MTVLPTLMSIVSLIAPLPDAAPHEAPVLAEQVQLVNVMPVGGVSATTAPATLFGPALLTTTVYVVLVPLATVVLLSVFVMDRSAAPVVDNVAVAAPLLVTFCADVKAPAGIVLTKLPAALPTTLTLRLQVAPAAMPAPDNATVDAPAVAVTVPEQPLPENDAPAGLATTMPVGSASVRLAPERAMLLGLVLTNRICNWLAVPRGTVAGENVLGR